MSNQHQNWMHDQENFAELSNPENKSMTFPNKNGYWSDGSFISWASPEYNENEHAERNGYIEKLENVDRLAWETHCINKPFNE